MYLTRQKLKFFLSFVIFLGLCNVFTNLLSYPAGKNEKRNANVLEGGNSGGNERGGADDVDSLTQQKYRGMVTDISHVNDYVQVTKTGHGTANDTSQLLQSLFPRTAMTISCDSDTRIIALISSQSSNSDLRQAIRQTWAKVSGNKTHMMRTMFVTGSKNANEKSGENKALMDEIRTHGDILLGDFVYDVKIKTTLPLLMGINWALGYCDYFQYVIFGCDTTIINERKLIERLEYCEKNGISDTRTWMGKISAFSKVQREPSSIFYISPEQYDKEYFPPFCTDENGHVITRLSAKEFLESALTREIVPIADVFIAIVAKERNWTLVDDGFFSSSAISESNICAAQASVTMHAPQKPQELVRAWKNIDNKTMLRECMDPDLDVVLPTNVDNRPYLEKVLAYKFNHPHVCYDKEGKPLDIFMIVLISTPPDHGEVRKAIRETWCKDHVVLGEVIRCVFVMGQLSSETAELRTKLRREDVKYGDIIQASFSESFQNLTLKVILGLKWITENCQHAKYFYKGDEDMFVNFNNIISYIKTLRSRGEGMAKFFIGSRLYASIRYSPNIPEHEGLKRYHVPDSMYFGHFYPPYCSGGGYILSTETVPNMYRESLRTSLINVDDAFQGILTKKLGFGPIGHTGFKNWGGKTDTCSLRDRNTMTVHGIGKAASNLYEVWNKYQNATANCTHIGI